MNADLCEGCRKRPFEVCIEDEESYRPYRVCRDCATRLENLSLRPLEWFNLVAVHGQRKYRLHEDFYDEDGNAELYYEQEVERPEDFPAPSLDAVRADRERLLDYCMSRWDITEEVLTALREHPSAEVFESLMRRVEQSGNTNMEITAYTLCAWALGPVAADWIRSRRDAFPDKLFSWAEAASRCLPPDEGFQLVIEALTGRDGQAFRDGMRALECFCSPRSLDWIESQLQPQDDTFPVTFEWGQLAALSKLSWSRIEEWLSLGRPLSLVALSALNYSVEFQTTPALRRLFGETKPTISDCPDRDTMISCLCSYEQQDPVPRVEAAVDNIIERISVICSKHA